MQAGATQTSIWMSAGDLLGVCIAGSLYGNGGHSIITVPQMLLFVLYFVLAFVPYLAVEARLGATTNSEQE